MYIRQRLRTLSRGLITIHISGPFNESWMALVVYSVFREFREFKEFRERIPAPSLREGHRPTWQSQIVIARLEKPWQSQSELWEIPTLRSE